MVLKAELKKLVAEVMIDDCFSGIYYAAEIIYLELQKTGLGSEGWY
jgi:bifunctional DNase/RNase